MQSRSTERTEKERGQYPCSFTEGQPYHGCGFDVREIPRIGFGLLLRAGFGLECLEFMSNL